MCSFFDASQPCFVLVVTRQYLVIAMGMGSTPRWRADGSAEQPADDAPETSAEQPAHASADIALVGATSTWQGDANKDKKQNLSSKEAQANQ